MRIRTRAVPYHFGVDLCAAVTCMVQFFEDHDPCALADDEASAVAVKGSRGTVGIVVEGGGEATGAAEATNGEGVNAGLGAAGYHDGGVAVGDEAAGVADGVGAGGTGCCGGVVWALVWRLAE